MMNYLFFPNFSLWAFVPPLMILGRSQCFAIYLFGTQMKGLVGPLISCFSAQTANIVLFGFMTWSLLGTSQGDGCTKGVQVKRRSSCIQPEKSL